MLDVNMDSRKRHLTDNDEGPGVVKKRIVEGPNGAPHVNGSTVDYDPDDRQEKQENDLEVRIRYTAAPTGSNDCTRPFGRRPCTDG